MAGPYSERHVRVHRDALTTSWGFRLQGGRDFKAPLTVQRVFVGSPADGELHRGDIILAIDNNPTTGMVHKQAMDIIKNAGGSLLFKVGRSAQPSRARTASPTLSSSAAANNTPQYIRSRPLDTSAPKPAPPIGKYPTKSAMSLGGGGPSFGTDYGSAPRRGYGGEPNMLNRVQASLDSAIYEPAARAQQNRPPGVVKPFVKPHSDLPRSMLEPGWTPGASRPAPAYKPVPTPVNRQQPINRPVNRPVQQEIPHIEAGPPAWAGSLRSSGGPGPWEMHAHDQLVPGQDPVAARGQGAPRQRPQPQTQQAPVAQEFQPPGVVTPHQPRVQVQNYGPGGAPASIGQHDGESHQGDAKVAHLQYNTPIGLYSKGNVQETLEAQTQGKAGYGTMQVTGTGSGPKQKEYNPAQSSVYRLIAEEEGRKQRPRGYARAAPEQQLQQQQQQPQAADGESARYQEHGPGQEMLYQGYQDHSRQSRSMHALEEHLANEGEIGASDF